jgi:hypothetical protein
MTSESVGCLNQMNIKDYYLERDRVLLCHVELSSVLLTQYRSRN